MQAMWTRKHAVLALYFALAACGDDSNAAPDAASERDGGHDSGASEPEAGAPGDAAHVNDAGADAGGDGAASDAALVDDAAGDDAAQGDGGANGAPSCRFAGTRSEGWYAQDGERICWITCRYGGEPRCENAGTSEEGWYTSEGSGCGETDLIVLADCDPS